MSKNNARKTQQSKKKRPFITGRRGVIGSLPEGWPVEEHETPEDAAEGTGRPCPPITLEEAAQWADYIGGGSGNDMSAKKGSEG